MKNRRLHAHILSVFSIGSAALLLGCSADLPDVSWTGSHGQASLPDYDVMETNQERDLDKTPPPQPEPAARRVRASLSLPYFSFAHSLRPRG
jgi:hypothetical protein